VGRVDDMLIVRGVNVFPSQVEAALLTIEHLTPHYVIMLDRKQHLDEMEVHVEVSEAFFSHVGQELFQRHPVEVVDDLRMLEERVKTVLREALGLNVGVRLLPPGKAPRSEGGFGMLRNLP